MPTRRYAERSTVKLQKSQGEILELLETWGCKKVGIFHHHDENRIEVQFVWAGDRGDYSARFSVSLKCSGDQLHRSENIQREYVQGRFRTLYYWIRAALNAVDAGVILPEQVFMPWLVTTDGRTLSERVFELEEGGVPLLTSQASQ